MRQEGKDVGNATGFFYEYGGRRFLITNRHVVIDEERHHYPDTLSIRVHSNNMDLTINENVEIPLYNSDRSPLWLEHPKLGREVDVVAVKADGILKSNHIVAAINSRNLRPSNVIVGGGEDVIIPCYPLGFYDDLHNLPVLRSGMIASPYPIPFRGQPFFLIDSWLHEGVSGSPVFTKPKSMFRYKDGSTAITSGELSFFIGIVSRALPPYEYPAGFEDKRLALYTVYFAELAEETVAQAGNI